MEAQLSDTWLDVGKFSPDDSTFVFSHNKVDSGQKGGLGVTDWKMAGYVLLWIRTNFVISWALENFEWPDVEW